MSTAQIIIIVLGSAGGALAAGTVGIGMALVAGPLLVSIDPAFAPLPLLLAGQIAGARHIGAEWEHIDWQAWRRALMGLPVGLGVGLAVLRVVPTRPMSIAIGLATAMAATILLAGIDLRRTTATEIAGGAMTAFSSSVAGMPGPPFVCVFSDMPGRTLRGTSAAFFICVAAIATALLFIAGEVGRHELELLAWMVPGTLLGLALARPIRPYVDRAWFRPAVLLVALAGGLALAARNIF